MKHVMTMMAVTALVAGVSAPAFADSKSSKMNKTGTVSTSEVVTGTNPGAVTIDGPNSAKNTERSAEGYSTTTGASTGPRGGSVNPNPRVMGRDTR